ncbi:hypothetical protein BM547_05250 [Pseudomonas aeruginosa]|nr:hypothetical protein [Pseudomonas aeruginosa]MBX6221429.1 hypothetical protein [Pseudomonas aeruginosa]OOK60220.1 hypothetical protein BM547_05250 [Pseudomonas aeruginosa]
MSEVKRFDHVNHAHVDDCAHIENPGGAWVKASDYDTLAAEAQALREERDSQQRVAIKAMEELAALRARVVVVPERKLLNAGVPGLNRNSGWNACLDELARLNGLTVSEGLLRRISNLFPDDMGDDGSGRAGWFPHVRETVAELRALLSE